MSNTPEILIFKDNFKQPDSVVEKFLDFTGSVFPDLFENGGEFLREGVEADYKHAPELYQASTVFSKLKNPDGLGSDILLLSPGGSGSRYEDPMLVHSYFYTNGYDVAKTHYKVVRGCLLAIPILDMRPRPPRSQYKQYQSVALTLGRAIGFERGIVDAERVDDAGNKKHLRDWYELVGEEELDALVGLFAPKNG